MSTYIQPPCNCAIMRTSDRKQVKHTWVLVDISFWSSSMTELSERFPTRGVGWEQANAGPESRRGIGIEVPDSDQEASRAPLLPPQSSPTGSSPARGEVPPRARLLVEFFDVEAVIGVPRASTAIPTMGESLVMSRSADLLSDRPFLLSTSPSYPTALEDQRSNPLERREKLKRKQEKVGSRLTGMSSMQLFLSFLTHSPYQSLFHFNS